MSEKQYLIRPFKREDKESVVELWKICRLTRPWNNPEKDIERKLNVQSEMFLVLEIEGSIIEGKGHWYTERQFTGPVGKLQLLWVPPYSRQSTTQKI